ncbi:MAG: response regulator transcription factor [Steroidobacteraceae bacterium]
MTPAPQSRIRILAVDDHPVLRTGISALIANQPDMALVGEAGNGADAVAMFRELRPDITLMDLQMPDMGGIECIEKIRAEFPTARIIVLTTFAGDALAARALRVGASAYVLKQLARTELMDRIRSINAGARHVQPEVAVDIAHHLGEEPLSAREVQVLALVAHGCSNKEIAGKLFISDQTIKGHLANILAKLRVDDRTHAVTVALRRGIIQL